jgi:beta-lactam-binding protein with PASTA domain/tRNA A-37 threonylcarbamoyl transferase component Bud32
LSPADITGRKVLNRYKLIEKLGGGGMSVVWKAYDLVLDRNVALKVLRPEMSEDEEFIRRFRREAQSVASLSHPNIVNIYDVGEDRGLYFIVMEFIEGETLRDLMRREGVLDPADALEIASEICEAISHAHARRIIHRDIKPQNILLTKQGHVKVADFGIARALGAISTTSRDLVVGSAPYLSPEQAKNGVVSNRSDIYSLGVVLYEMLTGKQPFAGDSPVAVALQHVQAEPPSVRKVNPSLPEEVANLVAKALRKNPDERFSSVEEMRREMGFILAGGVSDAGKDAPEREAPVSSGPEGDDDVVARPGKKRRGLSLGTKVFLAVLVIALAMGGYALKLFRDWMDVPLVMVPELAGKVLVQGQEEAKQLGLVVMISGWRNDPEVPANVIISQSPLPGEQVKQGREIWVLVSKGQDLATIPFVGNMTLKEAAIELQNADVSMGNVSRVYHEEIEKDWVISQNPKSGLEVPKNTPVDLVVSDGPEPQTVKTPPVTGMMLDEAKATLVNSLLGVGSINYQPSPEPEGTVIGQNPSPGTEVPYQYRVSLTVSGKTTTAKHRFVKTFRVPEEYGGTTNLVHVVITVRDDAGERIVYDRLLQPEVEQTVQFEWEGTQATVITDMGGRRSYETIRP